MNRNKIVLYLFPLFFNQYIFCKDTQSLSKITTYIDTPIVEQRQVFTKEEIKSMNVQDFPSLIQTTGIQLLSYGTYGLEQKPSIRGFTDETVRVVIDGICVNNPQYGTFDFSSININSVEKIEIVKGGFTEGVSEEGSVGGTIYITTKKQSLKNSFFSDSMTKSFFNRNVPFDTFSQMLGMNYQFGENTFFKTSIKGASAKNEFLYKNYKNQTDIRKNSAVHDICADFNLSHFFGNGNSWTLNDISYNGYKHIPGSETSFQSGIQQDYNNTVLFAMNFPMLNSLKTSFSWITTNRFYDEQNSKSIHHVNSFKFFSTAFIFKTKKYTQNLGFSFDFTNLDSTDDGIHQTFSGTIKETSKIKVNEKFSLSVPIALSFNNKNFAVIPKSGIKISFTKTELLFNIYRMVQFPNLDDLYWNSSGFHGNKNLKPESGWGAEFSINNTNPILPFSICVFTNYYKNKIQWAFISGTWQPENIASAFYLGCDVSCEKEFLKYFSIKANAEYLYNRLLDKSNQTTYGNRIMWTPDFTGAISLNMKTKKFNLGAEVSYTGKRYVSNLNKSIKKPYTLFNMYGTLLFWEKVTPYFRLDNILNTRYESIPDYPMPGISLQLGIKCNF